MQVIREGFRGANGRHLTRRSLVGHDIADIRKIVAVLQNEFDWEGVFEPDVQCGWITRFVVPTNKTKEFRKAYRIAKIDVLEAIRTFSDLVLIARVKGWHVWESKRTGYTHFACGTMHFILDSKHEWRMYLKKIAKMYGIIE